MIRQTVWDFKIERTEEQLTAHGGLALLAEYNHGLGLRQLSDQHLPAPGSNRGYAPSAFVESLILMLQAGGQSLEDLRELEQGAALMKLVGRDLLPDPDTVGDWLRRMGDPQIDPAGLQGLGRVRDLRVHPGCRCHADRSGKARGNPDLSRDEGIYAHAGLSLRDTGVCV